MPSLKKRLKRLLKHNKTAFNGRFQDRGDTAFMRYPDLFANAAAYTAQRGMDGPPVLLSFGCSTGIECFTLRSYFPDATIIGYDFDEEAVAEARKNTHDKNMHFIHGDRGQLRELGPFDGIFSLAVFCRHPVSNTTEDILSLLPPDKVMDALDFQKSILAPGGFIAIANANYRHADLDPLATMNVLRSPTLIDNGFVDKFGVDGTRLTRLRANEPTVFYTELCCPPDELTESDFTDAIYVNGPAPRLSGAARKIGLLDSKKAASKGVVIERPEVESEGPYGVVYPFEEIEIFSLEGGRYAARRTLRRLQLDGSVKTFGTTESFVSKPLALNYIQKAEQAIIGPGQNVPVMGKAEAKGKAVISVSNTRLSS